MAAPKMGSDFIFNWASGQAVKREGRIGQLLESVDNATEEEWEHAVKSYDENPEWIYHPGLGRFVLSNTGDGAILVAAWGNYHSNWDYPPRPAGKVMNPETGKFVKAGGKVGRDLVGRWSCLQYEDRPERLDFEFRDYQVEVANYFVQSPYRGILLYWSLGTGKTCGSILALDAMLDEYEIEKVFIFTTGSLRENFMREYCVKCGEDPERLNVFFTFVTYNYANILGELPSIDDLENSIIIVDEVHIILHGVKNQSDTHVAIYNLLRSVDRCRFILLSGTPMVDDVRELEMLITLLDPEAFVDRDFASYYTVEGSRKIPKPELYDKVSGIISHVSIDQNSPDYPKWEVVKIPITLTDDQEQNYEYARSKEQMFIRADDRLKFTDRAKYDMQKRLGYLIASMKRSRQRTNMVYPQDIQDKLDDWERRGEVPPDKLVRNGGWITPEIIQNLQEYAPKFWFVIENIKNIQCKHVIYSEFKTRYGVFFISAVLDALGITNLVFSGDKNDEKKREILNKFNAYDNRFGDQVKVLLITKAGGIGQSFLAVQYMYIMEQSVSENEIEQVMGRVVRFESHKHLPEEQRKVNIVRLFGVLPPKQDDDPEYFAADEFDEVPEDRATSDFLAYFRGMAKQNSIRDTYDLLKTLPAVPPMPCVSEAVEVAVEAVGEVGAEEDDQFEFDSVADPGVGVELPPPPSPPPEPLVVSPWMLQPLEGPLPPPLQVGSAPGSPAGYHDLPLPPPPGPERGLFYSPPLPRRPSDLPLRQSL